MNVITLLRKIDDTLDSLLIYVMEDVISGWVHRHAFKNGAKFVDSLDRKSLGKFAVDRDVLNIVAAAYYLYNNKFWQLQKERNVLFDPTYSGAFIRTLDEALINAGYKGNHQYLWQAEMEIVFWWKLHQPDSPMMLVNFYKHLDADAIAIEHARYMLIRQYPEYHNYFLQEIWDIDYIKRCLTDNIDAELAWELMS